MGQSHSSAPIPGNSTSGIPQDTHDIPRSQCPVSKTKVNDQNQMPVLSQMSQPGQLSALPTERVISSIPRSTVVSESSSNNWEYPSPQQFHNALVRKGWETPEEHVETMVEIHNFLNEEAWKEVLKWEKKWTGGDSQPPELEKLQGLPGQLSPKARIHLLAGWLLPSKFSSEPPFDRHDWVIRRPSSGERIRYVIDYYSAPPERDGSPVFSLDVRPALESMASLKVRLSTASEEAWQALHHGD